jgi:hypothetical protein
MNLTVNGIPAEVPPGSAPPQTRRAAGESVTYA